MLSEQQCTYIETGLTEDVEPRKVAAYLCLHMGLTLAEVTALRLRDVDADAGVVSLVSAVSATGVLTPLAKGRALPMPPHVQRYVKRHRGLYESGDCFILTGGTSVPPFYPMQNLLTSLCAKYRICHALSCSDLRNAFIRRCIQSGMDLYSICAYVGIKQPNVIVKRFGAYFTPRLEGVYALSAFNAEP